MKKFNLQDLSVTCLAMKVKIALLMCFDKDCTRFKCMKYLLCSTLLYFIGLVGDLLGDEGIIKNMNTMFVADWFVQKSEI